MIKINHNTEAFMICSCMDLDYVTGLNAAHYQHMLAAGQ